MTATQQPKEGGRLTVAQGSRTRPQEGIVTGHLFKIVRERMPCTQRQLAEQLGIDTTTVQGWESGRRPLTAVPSSQFRTLQRHLLRGGAHPALLFLFDAAMDADSVIAHALGQERVRDDLRTHPLAGWVFTRATAHMIAWALTGAAPAALPLPTEPLPRRRGPSPDSPMLGEPERRRFFEHMRRVAELADHSGGAGTLLRRQASYLCSYDTSTDTHAWLAEMQRRKPPKLNHSSWTPEWADARSLATSLTRHGEDDMLHAFIERGMSSDAGEVANLNYWAHWLGLDPLPRPDDAFMADCSQSLWDAGALLRSLADRLDPGLGCVDLNIHSVWALIGSRPGLLATDPVLVRDLKSRIAALFDSGTMSRQARRELDAVHYGLRLNNS